MWKQFKMWSVHQIAWRYRFNRCIAQMREMGDKDAYDYPGSWYRWICREYQAGRYAPLGFKRTPAYRKQKRFANRIYRNLNPFWPYWD